MSKIRTAEYVSPSHPDKTCDRISDGILEAYLSQDPLSRVAVDVAGGHGTVFVVGEVTSTAKSIDIEEIVRNLAGNVEVIVRIEKQSPQIAAGVDTGGAGDQGIMVGYACNETPDYLPLEFALAKSLNEYLYKRWPYDGKTQVTTDNGQVSVIVASFQNSKSSELYKAVEEWLDSENLALANSDTTILVNPAGDWTIGGFDADSGLTGRKIVVDSYGPRVPVGGGAFSGKDLTKVDRSGALVAKKIAIDYLEKRQASEVLVYLAYAIGVNAPVQATVVIDGVEEHVHGYDLSATSLLKA